MEVRVLEAPRRNIGNRTCISLITYRARTLNRKTESDQDMHHSNGPGNVTSIEHCFSLLNVHLTVEGLGEQ